MANRLPTPLGRRPQDSGLRLRRGFAPTRPVPPPANDNPMPLMRRWRRLARVALVASLVGAVGLLAVL